MTASQLALGVRLRDDARFDNFHGERNQAVARRLQLLCEPPASVPVVTVCGDADTGKSHLLQAACHHVEAQGGSALCLSIGEIRPFGPGALAGLDSPELVCLDDLHLIAGDLAWEETVFHLYNRIIDQGHMLVVSLTNVVSATRFVLPDLASRLGHGVSLQLGIYRDTDRLIILQARAEQRGLVMGDEVAAFILRRAPRRLGDLLAMLDLLDVNSLQAQRRLTIPFVKTVMGW